MKRRIITTIVFCTFIIILSLVWLTIKLYLLNSNSGMNNTVFIPASVVEVTEDDDLLVNVYPIDITHHEIKNQVLNLNLNDIEKGWITNSYDGNCRLVFEQNDSELKDVYADDGCKYYYYADLVPTNRLAIENCIDQLTEDSTDPFSQDSRPHFYSDSIKTEILNYYDRKNAIMYCVVIDTAIIVLTLIVNVVSYYFSNKQVTR